MRVTQSTGQMIAVKDPTSAKCNGGRLRPYTGLMSNFRIEGTRSLRVATCFRGPWRRADPYCNLRAVWSHRRRSPQQARVSHLLGLERLRRRLHVVRLALRSLRNN